MGDGYDGPDALRVVAGTLREIRFLPRGLVSVVRKRAKEGAELIQKMMVDFRADPPKTILGFLVVKINDFQTLEKRPT